MFIQVLVLTIEEEPPSLRTYPTGERQRTGAPFSKAFEEFYVKCLQKVRTRAPLMTSQLYYCNPLPRLRNNVSHVLLCVVARRRGIDPRPRNC